MKRILFSLFLSVMLILTLSLVVSAAVGLPMVVDNADLLDPAEESSLEEKAQELRSQYEMDIVILTVDSLNGKTAQDYADDYYDENGYGYDENGSGVLFLLAMAEREWYISTCGEAIYALTDYGIQQLGETAFSYLYGDDFEPVFDAFLTVLPEYLDAHEVGAPVDGYADDSEDYYHGEQDTVVYYEEEYSPSIFLSLVIGVIAAAVVSLIMRSSMNTKRKQYNASSYMKNESFHLKRHQDLFLYSNVSKVRRQQNNSSSGGGSSVHRSSGGRRHGGGGGRF